MADHDHVLLNMVAMGRQRIFLEDLEFDWPPPERLFMDGDTHLLREATDDDDKNFIFKRISMSLLTDEQMVKCPGVARGAEYVYEVTVH